MTKPVTLEELDDAIQQCEAHDPFALHRDWSIRQMKQHRLALAVVKTAQKLMDSPECSCGYDDATCSYCSRWEGVMHTLSAFDKGGA